MTRPSGTWRFGDSPLDELARIAHQVLEEQRRGGAELPPGFEARVAWAIAQRAKHLLPASRP
jgi:hypothetical protein